MLRRDYDTFPEFKTDEFDDDLDLPDDYDDPFAPKPTCFHCEGLGTITLNDHEYPCTYCGGTGCQR